MAKIISLHKFLVFLLLCILLGCTGPIAPRPDIEEHAVFVSDGPSLLHKHAPVFIIEEPQHSYNLIGTPAAFVSGEGEETVFVNANKLAAFTDLRRFETDRGEYLNLIYRIHFEKVPMHHITGGQNVGLIVVVTLNQADEPLLVTLVHTCGCYLAMIPTSYLPDDALPRNWHRNARQGVYGKNLPSNLDLHHPGTIDKKIILLLEDGTHRVKNAWSEPRDAVSKASVINMPLQPLDSLEKLSLADGQTTSFFEGSGPRKGFVKGSRKPWERLLISWWAIDSRVGEDKKLGRDLEDGTSFYTSLKPWARQASDMRDFAKFLAYWGWQL